MNIGFKFLGVKRKAKSLKEREKKKRVKLLHNYTVFLSGFLLDENCNINTIRCWLNKVL